MELVLPLFVTRFLRANIAFHPYLLTRSSKWTLCTLKSFRYYDIESTGVVAWSAYRHSLISHSQPLPLEIITVTTAIKRVKWISTVMKALLQDQASSSMSDERVGRILEAVQYQEHPFERKIKLTLA